MNMNITLAITVSWPIVLAFFAGVVIGIAAFVFLVWKMLEIWSRY